MRRVLKILLAVVVVLVVAVVAAVLLIPRDRVIALAVDQVRAATGRELVLEGDVSPSFWPVLGVRTGAVRLSNADWAEAPDMISASTAEIGVELMPLFSGEVKVTKLRLVDLVAALEIGRDGVPNWQFDDGTAAQGGGAGDSGEIPKIALPEADIKNGSVTFHDARSGQRIELTALDLTAGLAGMDAPLTLEGSGNWNGKRAEISARVDTPAAAMQGQMAAVRLALASDPANLTFDGDVALAEGDALPRVDGAVSAALPDIEAALAWALGTGAPAGLGEIGAVKLDGTVAATETALKLAAKGSVGYRGRPMAFDLRADGGAGWLDRQAFDLALAARADGLFNLTFSGPVAGGAAPSAQGPLKLSIHDLSGLAEWASGAALDTPAGSFESADIEAGLTLSGGDQLSLSGLTMRVDDTRLTGEAGASLGGARPMVTARLESGPLDLSPFMAPSGAQPAAGPSQGWSTEPLDLSALRTVDADVGIRADSVDLGQIDIGRTDIAARLRDGRLDMEIHRVDAYGGGMNGTVLVEAGAEPRIATDLTISQVQLRPLLNAMAGFDNLEGLGAFRIEVDGRGGSMDALMRSLNGAGGLELTNGAILGVNLAAMVRNLTGQGGGEQKTDFSAVSGTFDISNGVLHNTDFSFLGPLLRVVGAGTVDLGGQTQNFRLEPTAVASLTGQGGTLENSGLGIFPILITGSWSNPSIRPDLTAAIEGLMADPEGTIEAVTGLVQGADPGQAAGALIGAVTGGADQDSPAGAVGEMLGGVLGGQRPESGGTAQGGPAGALDQVLGGGRGGQRPERGDGAAGAGRQGQQAAPERDDGTVAQPRSGSLLSALDSSGGTAAGEPQAAAGDSDPASPSGDQALPAPDDGGLAPQIAPLPRPAAPARARLAALPGGGAEPEPAEAPATAPAAAAPPSDAPASDAPPAETPTAEPSAAAPSAAETPAAETPAAATPAPQPAAEPESAETVPQPDSSSAAPAAEQEDQTDGGDGDGKRRGKKRRNRVLDQATDAIRRGGRN